MKKLTILLPTLAALSLSSCATNDHHQDPTLAEEFAYGTAVMIVTPFEMTHDAASHVAETTTNVLKAPFR